MSVGGASEARVRVLLSYFRLYCAIRTSSVHPWKKRWQREREGEASLAASKGRRELTNRR